MELELNHIIDALPGLILTALPDGRAAFVNQRWCQYTGLCPDQAIGFGWQSAIHPEDLATALERWLSFPQSGEPGEVKARLRRYDGEYRRFLLGAAPIRDHSGRVVRLCVSATDIDDGKLAEGARRESERGFRLALDGIPGLVAILAPDGGVEVVNRQIVDYSGQSLEELKNWATNGTVHHEDLPHVAETFGRSIASGIPYQIELRLRRYDGEYRWFDNRGVPFRDDAGRILRWHVLLTDIENRKRAEEELLRREAFLRQGEAVSETGTFLWRLEPNEIRWSDQLYRIFEFEPGVPVTLELIAARVHPEDLPLMKDMVDRARAGRDFEYDHRLLMSGGSVKYVHLDAHAQRDHEGRLEYIGAARDVTESKVKEEALKAREAELRRANQYLTSAQELSQTGSYTWDVMTDKQNLSDQMYRIWEFDPGKEVTHDIVLGRIHPEDLPTFEGAQGAAVKAGEDFKLAYRIVTDSGAVKHFRTVSRRLADVTDRLVYVGATQDVTEIKLAEEALNRARAESAHVARVMTLGALTASIAHEVNQPLSGIITNASTCLRMLGADPPNLDGARMTAQRTLRDGNRASEVIQRLRAMFAHKEPTTEPIDLNEAAREVLALSSSELQRSQVILRTDFDEGLPVVRGDRVQLQQVILNLILNAADAMREIDDRRRDLMVATASQDGNRVRLSVRDSGIGIDPQNSNKLFDAFFTTKPHGMGVGLSISRSIIESHEGRLWATANDGPGATFSFLLPGGSEPAVSGKADP